MARPPFATYEEIEERHPRELAVLAADETTRLPDRARVDAALIDVSTEIRAILYARYSAADLDRLDADSRGALRLYAIDMALYRVALASSRVTDPVRERYETAVKRLQAIATGRGGLTMVGDGADPSDPDAASGSGASPSMPQVAAPERIFTRQRYRRGG